LGGPTVRLRERRRETGSPPLDAAPDRRPLVGVDRQPPGQHGVDYLTKFGFGDIQAYMILGSAPIEGRLSGVVDIPNSCSTVYIPTGIFDIDVRPSAAGPAQVCSGHGRAEGQFLTPRRRCPPDRRQAAWTQGPID
jgi:hypothetical protein